MMSLQQKYDIQVEIADMYRNEAARLRAAIQNVRNSLEMHADDWQDSYRLTAIAVPSDALETEE